MPLGRRRRTFQPSGTLAAPVNTVLPSIAGLPGVGVQLSATFGVWTGFPAPTYSYQWKRDGANIGTNSPFYTLVLADVGALITCDVTATNSQAPGGVTVSSSNSVGPIVPLPSKITDPVASVSSAVVGQTASVSAGSWNDALTYAYQWFENGALVPGATLTTFLLSTSGATVYCRVTATNTGGSTPQNSNTLGPVGLAPQNTAIPTISGTAAAGQTLTRTTGSWSGYPASYTYATKWYADDVEIAGQTGSTLLLTPLHAGKAITVSVLASNATGPAAAAAFSAPTSLVTSAPSFEGPPVLAGVAAVGQTLTVTVPELYAYPAAALSYAWYADATLIASAVTASHVLTSLQEGDTITAVVTAINVYGSDTDTTNGVGPIAPPEPLAGQWDLVANDGLILIAPDGQRLVANDYTNDVLSNVVITPLAGGTTASVAMDCSAVVGTIGMIATLKDTYASPPLPADIVDWALNGGNPAVVWRTAFSLTSATDASMGITGLTQNTFYDFYAAVHKSADINDYSNVATVEFESEDAPPSLAALIATAKSTTSAIAGWTTTDQTGSSKWAVYLATATPSDDDIIAGTGAVVSGTKANSATGRVSVPNITGLSANQNYTFHVIQIDVNTNRSNRASYNFSTPAAQTTAFQMANAGVATGLTLANLTATTAQSDPLGGSNAIKLGRDPNGVNTACSVARITTGGVVPTAIEVQAFVKKREWASSAAWVRFRATSIDAPLAISFDLDSAVFASISSRITNPICVPLDTGGYFLKFTADIYVDGTDDTDGSYAFELGRSATNLTIQTAGLHAIDLYDYKIVYH